MKVDKTIKKETLYLVYGILILSALMQAVFLIVGKWSIFVLIGNIIGGGVSALNFFLMGLTIQRSLKEEAEDAKKRMKVSQQLRTLMVFVIICIAAILTVYDVVPEEETTPYILSLILPLLFNRIIIAIRSRNVVE